MGSANDQQALRHQKCVWLADSSTNGRGARGGIFFEFAKLALPLVFDSRTASAYD